MSFQYEPFSNQPYVGRIADLMERQGEAQARGALGSGQAWAGAMRDIGQLPERITQMREAGAIADQRAMQTAQVRRAMQGQQVLSALIQKHRQVDPETGASKIDHEAVASELSAAGFPDAAGNWLKLSADNAESLEKLRSTQQARRQAVLTAIGGAAAKASDPQDFLSRVGLLYHDGDGAIDADMMKTIASNLQQAGPEGWPQIKARYVDFANQYGKKTVLPRPGASISNDVTGETTTPVPVAPPKPTEASLAADAAAGNAQAGAALKLLKPDKPDTASQEDQRYEKIVAARAQQQPVSPEDSAWAGAYEKRKTLGTTTTFNLKNAADKETVTDQAEQVRNGMLPPSMLSKRSSSYNAILAEANRQEKEETGKPLNLGQLELNYRAAQRFVASLNGPNMVRFQALGKSVVNTIDEVRTLADELKQGGIQKWNSAKRSTILQVYGNSPQSEIAVRYLAAVNTLKEEYANLANGGYAPTEPAWKLANDQINGDYGVKDLNASLTESQRLINFRLSGFTGLSPIQMGGAQPSAPEPPAAAKPIKVGPFTVTVK